MQHNDTQIASTVRNLPTDLTPEQVIQTVDNGNGTLTVTETRTRTITVSRESGRHVDAALHRTGAAYPEDLADLPTPTPQWPIYFIFAALALGMFAAIVDVLGEFAMIMQENPVPVVFAIGLLIGAAGLLLTSKGGR